MLAIIAAVAGVATAGALAWYKVLLPVNRMLALSDELSEPAWRGAFPAPGASAFRTSSDLANLAAATGPAAGPPAAAPQESGAPPSHGRRRRAPVDSGSSGSLPCALAQASWRRAHQQRV